jgi:streptomycin 6-kinase
VLGRLADRWSFRLGRALPGGSTSYVTRVIMADGAERVLKVGIPGRDLGAEVAALDAADGRGCARLYAHDPDADAYLLELLGPALERSTRPPAEQVMISGRVLRDVWRPLAPTDAEAAATPVKARDLGTFVLATWREHGRPCDPAVVDQAAVYAELLVAAHAPERCVWVHGDPHPGNLLACPVREGAPEGYVFVDPEPFVDDPAYDLGVVLRDWSRLLLAAEDPQGWLRARCADLAGLTGVDAEVIWRWAYLERVSSGLYIHSFGAEQVARPFLDSAARLLS